MTEQKIPHTTPRMSATFTNDINSDIRRAAATGIYDIRGGGAKRRVPQFRRPAVSGRLDLALPAGRLPREMRDQRDHRRAAREKPD